MKALLITVAVVGVLAGIAVPVFKIGHPVVFGVLIALALVGYAIQEVRFKKKDKAIRAAIAKQQEDRPSLSPVEFATRYFPAEEQRIAEDVRRALEKLVQSDMSRVSPSDRFNEDLHIDHFDDMNSIAILEEIERQYQIKFDDKEAENIRTVGDFVSAIRAKAA